MLKSYPLGPQNVTLFENRVVVDVVNQDELILELGGPKPNIGVGWAQTQYDWCLIRTVECHMKMETHV